jgi:hypothetical protein
MRLSAKLSNSSPLDHGIGVRDLRGLFGCSAGYAGTNCMSRNIHSALSSSFKVPRVASITLYQSVDL